MKLSDLCNCEHLLTSVVVSNRSLDASFGESVVPLCSYFMFNKRKSFAANIVLRERPNHRIGEDHGGPLRFEPALEPAGRCWSRSRTFIGICKSRKALEWKLSMGSVPTLDFWEKSVVRLSNQQNRTWRFRPCWIPFSKGAVFFCGKLWSHAVANPYTIIHPWDVPRVLLNPRPGMANFPAEVAAAWDPVRLLRGSWDSHHSCMMAPECTRQGISSYEMICYIMQYTCTVYMYGIQSISCSYILTYTEFTCDCLCGLSCPQGQMLNHGGWRNLTDMTLPPVTTRLRHVINWWWRWLTFDNGVVDVWLISLNYSMNGWLLYVYFFLIHIYIYIVTICYDHHGSIAFGCNHRTVHLQSLSHITSYHFYPLSDSIYNFLL